MDKNRLWLKFVLSGNPKDYLSYVNQSVNEEGESLEDSNRRISGKRSEYGGSRPIDYNSYKG